MLWYQASNSSSVKPDEVDQTSSPTCVYVRKDFELVPASGEGEQITPEHWTYKEMKMSPEEFDLYQDNVALRDYLDMIS